VTTIRALHITRHVAQFPDTKRRGSAIDHRNTCHPGYAISQRQRKLVEQAVRWMKTVGCSDDGVIAAEGWSIGSSAAPSPRTTCYDGGT
jgi:hypothetical protein